MPVLKFKTLVERLKRDERLRIAVSGLVDGYNMPTPDLFDDGGRGSFPDAKSNETELYETGVHLGQIVAQNHVYAEVGDVVFVTNPKHSDSMHTHEFEGTVTAKRSGEVKTGVIASRPGTIYTVTDQEGNAFDVADDEIEGLDDQDDDDPHDLDSV